MDSTVLAFLREILGVDGARSLLKAADREPAIGFIVAPRAALAWLAPKTSYEGSVPGVENSYLKFRKSEDGYTGVVTLAESNYLFESASQAHVASAIAWASGVSNMETVEIADKTLAKLGKAIDALVEAQLLAKKVLDPKDGYSFRHESEHGIHKVTALSRQGEVVGVAQFQHTPEGLKSSHVIVDEPHQRRGVASAMYAHAEKSTGMKVLPSPLQTEEGEKLWAGNAQAKQFGKVELPGQTAKPKKQLGPIEPTPPTKQRSLPRIPVVKVEKAEAQHECPDCGLHNFADNKFVGCICHRELAKSVRTVTYSDGLVLEFKPGADRDEVAVLRRQLKKT